MKFINLFTSLDYLLTNFPTFKKACSIVVSTGTNCTDKVGSE